jgi:type II secretory pathway predicted ATPase ExeA
MSIYLKLQQARVELQKQPIKKSGENKFSKFHYFELADFLPTINELFLKHKLIDVFSLYADRAELVIYDAESDQKLVFTSATATAEMKGVTPIQQKGAENTYMRRYLLLNALNIVENDVLDPLVGSDKVANNSALSDKQLGLLQSLTANITSDALKTRLTALYGVDRLETLSIDQASDLITRIKNKG